MVLRRASASFVAVMLGAAFVSGCGLLSSNLTDSPCSFPGLQLVVGVVCFKSPPTVTSLSLQILTIHKTEQLTWGGDEVCPDPILSSHELNFRFSRASTTRWFSASISIAVGTNCVPHPTEAGQTVIAGDFKQASGQS